MLNRLYISDLSLDDFIMHRLEFQNRLRPCQSTKGLWFDKEAQVFFRLTDPVN
jgi:hypothetical protein